MPSPDLVSNGQARCWMPYPDLSTASSIILCYFKCASHLATVPQIARCEMRCACWKIFFAESLLVLEGME